MPNCPASSSATLLGSRCRSISSRQISAPTALDRKTPPRTVSNTASPPSAAMARTLALARSTPSPSHSGARRLFRIQLNIRAVSFGQVAVLKSLPQPKLQEDDLAQLRAIRFQALAQPEQAPAHTRRVHAAHLHQEHRLRILQQHNTALPHASQEHAFVV